MSTSKTIMFYKPGKGLKRRDIEKLEAADILCVELKDFESVQFPAARGMAFFTPDDDVGVMVLKAAVDDYAFAGRLGKQIVAAMKERAGIK